MIELTTPRSMSAEDIRGRISKLGEWFQNIELAGIPTAPNHFLGDYPSAKWKLFAHSIPADLSGLSVLDVGCNAGFYSMEMKRRGADRVLGIDHDPAYLAQAQFAAEVNGLEIEFRQMDVYSVAELQERFDLVLFMGVLYHLRHPLLALELLHQHGVKNLFVFQSLLRGSPEVSALREDYPFAEEEIFNHPDYPVMHFVEHRYAHDPTNWWIPNRACVEAMLRSTNFKILDHPVDDVYICQGGPRD